MIRENILIKISELALLIGVTERSIERNLKKLQAENHLSRIGPDRTGQRRLLESQRMIEDQLESGIETDRKN